MDFLVDEALLLGACLVLDVEKHLLAASASWQSKSLEDGGVDTLDLKVILQTGEWSRDTREGEMVVCTVAVVVCSVPRCSRGSGLKSRPESRAEYGDGTAVSAASSTLDQENRSPGLGEVGHSRSKSKDHCRLCCSAISAMLSCSTCRACS